jgi:hypothetical protein
MTITTKQVLTYLVLATAVIGGLGPTVAQLAGVVPAPYLAAIVHFIGVCAALHLYLIQSPLIQPFLATKTPVEVIAQAKKALP